MSATPDTRPRPDAAFVQAWCAALAHVLGQVTSSEISCVALPEAPPQLAPRSKADGETDPETGLETDIWIIGTCSGALRGEISLRLNPALGLGFAQVFMGEPAAPEVALTGEPREAVVELFRQVGGVVVTSLKAHFNDEVQLRLEAAPGAPSWPASSTSWLRAAPAGMADAPVKSASVESASVAPPSGAPASTAPTGVVELSLSAAVTASLASATEASAQAEAARQLAPPSDLARDSGSASPEEESPATASVVSAQNNTKLELLMDVELAMTLRFGSRNLLLREILDLCPGAVVELDRQVKDPVELMLDGRLVARGEVVVIDGNYGLRVTEVISGRES